jgi:formylmethanofuran dehydrogenase subunit E
VGECALRALILERSSFDLDVVHFAPARVQYACIIDGVAAATGASLGTLNLRLPEAPAVEMHTVYRRKSTGVSLRLRVTPLFASHFDAQGLAQLSAYKFSFATP